MEIVSRKGRASERKKGEREREREWSGFPTLSPLETIKCLILFEHEKDNDTYDKKRKWSCLLKKKRWRRIGQEHQMIWCWFFDWNIGQRSQKKSLTWQGLRNKTEKINHEWWCRNVFVHIWNLENWSIELKGSRSSRQRWQLSIFIDILKVMITVLSADTTDQSFVFFFCLSVSSCLFYWHFTYTVKMTKKKHIRN